VGIMKNMLSKFALIGSAAIIFNAGLAFADTASSPDKPAAPGTAAETDSKTQENNPSGPTTQTTSHPKEGTKKKKHKTHAPTTTTDASGDKATKTPQSTSAPSTNNP
jgi:hypothetical protein